MSNNVIQESISPQDKKMLFLLLFMPCITVFGQALNNDIWFLLNSGRYVVDYGIPHVEPFTIHRGLSFVMQQWLSNVIFWITYQAAGEIGIKIIILLFNIVVVYLMYRLCIKISNGNFFVSFSVCLCFSVLINLFMISRPIIFTLTIVLLELYCLESFIKDNNNKYLMILPILSVFLINLHAAMWPILFIIIGPYLIDSFDFKLGPIRGQGFEKKTLFLVVLLMFALGFCNPYGLDAMTYFFRSYGYPEISTWVIEMKPANINSLAGLLIFSSISLVFVTYWIFGRKNTALRYFLLTIGTAYMALSSIRNLSLFAVCGFFPVANIAKGFTVRSDQDLTPKWIMIKKITIILIVFGLIIIVALITTKGENTSEVYRDLNGVLDYLEQEKQSSDISIYTGYEQGNLAEFRGVKVYIDARAEVFVKKNNKVADIMLEYRDLQKGKLYYKSFLNKYDFDYLIVSDEDILATYLPYDEDYQLVYANSSYQLFKNN